MKPIYTAFILSACMHFFLMSLIWHNLAFTTPNKLVSPPHTLSVSVFMDEHQNTITTIPHSQPSHLSKIMTEKQSVTPTKHVTKQHISVSKNDPSVNEMTTAQHETRATPTEQSTTETIRSYQTQYQFTLLKLIETEKVYPNKAQRLHHQGTVRITFTIKADGSVINIHLDNSSGSTILDDAALALIRGISGQLPFPAEISSREQRFSIPLEYKLN